MMAIRAKAGNRLSHYMLRRRMTVDAMTEVVTDSNATGIWMMEQGAVLPTRRDLCAICDALGVKSTEIWDAEDLDLLGLMHEGNGSGHGEQVRFRVWMMPEEKRKLLQAIKKLGFQDATSWFKTAAAITVKKAAQRAEKRGV